jgi:hypothetical protein
MTACLLLPSFLHKPPAITYSSSCRSTDAPLSVSEEQSTSYTECTTSHYAQYCYNNSSHLALTLLL